MSFERQQVHLIWVKCGIVGHPVRESWNWTLQVTVATNNGTRFLRMRANEIRT